MQGLIKQWCCCGHCGGAGAGGAGAGNVVMLAQHLNQEERLTIFSVRHV